jgi:hypothetical protein
MSALNRFRQLEPIPPIRQRRTMTALRLIAALPLLALAACVPAPAPAPAPSPSPTVIPAPAPPATPLPTPAYENWIDAPQTPGNWFYAAIAPYTYAAFGPAATQPIASFRCDRASRTVSIGRTSGSTTAQPLTIRAETMERTFAAQPRQGSVEHLLAVDLPANDPLLDAIAFSQGRFTIEAAGEVPLFLPAWPEISRVIDDCR